MSEHNSKKRFHIKHLRLNLIDNCQTDNYFVFQKEVGKIVFVGEKKECEDFITRYYDKNNPNKYVIRYYSNED